MPIANYCSPNAKEPTDSGFSATQEVIFNVARNPNPGLAYVIATKRVGCSLTFY